MGNKKLRVGIAGYGVVGVRRRQFIDVHPSLVTVALCDSKFTSEGTVEGVRCYPEYQAMLAKESLDILFVSLPPDAAPEATIAGLKKGLHIFCEKPPARTVEEMQQVCAVERDFPHLKLKYGFNHRYHESVREALAIVQSKELGGLINMRGVYGKSAIIPWPRPSAETMREKGAQYWRTSRQIAGGGILLDQGIHMVDLMRLFAGDFVDVKSFVSNGYWQHDVEDNAYALLRTQTGVVAMLHSTATQWRHTFSLEMFLSEGAVVLSGILSGTRSYGQETLRLIFRSDEDYGLPREEIRSYLHDHSWRDEIYEFVDAIQNQQPIISGNSLDALKSMQLVYGIYNADQEWKKKMSGEVA